MDVQSKKAELELNQDKTKVITNKFTTPITVNSTTLNYVEDYNKPRPPHFI